VRNEGADYWRDLEPEEFAEAKQEQNKNGEASEAGLEGGKPVD
jgi:hypothetical protein